MFQSDDFLCLIDGSSFLHRAISVAPRTPDAQGVERQAILLMTRMVAKISRRMAAGAHPPSHVLAVFDPASASTWRREMFPAYKAHRPAMDPALYAQMAPMKAVWSAAGVAVAQAPRHEADDMIAGYAGLAAAAGARVVVMSRDKDLMQLIGPGTVQYDPVDDRWFREEDVIKKFGVPPALVRDWLSLVGDKADGVPGAPGLGAVAATTLLLEFGDLTVLLEDPERARRPNWIRILREHREIIEISRTLVSFDLDGCPLFLSPSAMRAPIWSGVSLKMERLRKHMQDALRFGN